MHQCQVRASQLKIRCLHYIPYPTEKLPFQFIGCTCSTVNSEIRNIVNLQQKEGRYSLAGADEIEPGQSETDGIDPDQRVGTESRSANTRRRTSLGRISRRRRRTTLLTHATHASQREEGWLTDTDKWVLVFRLLFFFFFFFGYLEWSGLYIFSHDLLMNISYYHPFQTHPNAYKENLDILVIWFYTTTYVVHRWASNW